MGGHRLLVIAISEYGVYLIITLIKANDPDLWRDSSENKNANMWELRRESWLRRKDPEILHLLNQIC